MLCSHPFLQILIIIIFIQELPQINANSRSSYLLSSTQTSFDCTNLCSYTPTSTSYPLNLPSGLRSIAVSFTFKPTSRCSAGPDYVPVALSIIPTGETARRQIFIMSNRDNRMYYSGADKNAGMSIMNVPISTFIDNPMTVYFSIDFAASTPMIRSSFAVDNNYFVPSDIPITVDSTWNFDSSTVLDICSGISGSMAIGCLVENLKISYTVPAHPGLMLFTNTVKLLADYKLEDGSGLSLENEQKSPGSLADASLSSSTSPTWASDGGLTFSFDPTKYILIPGFKASGQDMSVTVSVAFAFYIRIDQNPSSDGRILSYTLNSNGNEIFALSFISGKKTSNNNRQFNYTNITSYSWRMDANLCLLYNNLWRLWTFIHF